MKNKPKDDKLAIAYRIYPGKPDKAPICQDNKLLLSEKCLRSLRDSLEGVNYKLWAILDNCPDEYVTLFESIIPKDRLEIKRFGYIGNIGTFLEQIKILSEQTFSENIYFSEDDYIYVPNSFKHALDFLNEDKEADFITLYDHIDYYEAPNHSKKSIIKINSQLHWRMVSSSCLTFLTTKTVLRKSKDMFLTFAKNNGDASIWLPLTKKGYFNLIFNKKLFDSDQKYLRILVKSLFFGIKHLLFGRKFKLWSPIPSINTHMDAKKLAPGIAWEKLYN